MNRSEPGNYWASWVLVALGLWELAAAPFVLKYGPHFVMTANAVGFGTLIFIFGYWTVATDHPWTSRVCIGFGLWLIVAAVVFERALPRALANDVVVGALTVVVAYFGARHGRLAWERGWPTIARGEGHLTSRDRASLQ